LSWQEAINSRALSIFARSDMPPPLIAMIAFSWASSPMWV